MLNILYALLEALAIFLPVLLGVAFVTVIERKGLAAMQRRVGPNVVGYYGVLQPFADALKLVGKETVLPAQANLGLFYLAPIVSLVSSVLGWGVVPFGPGLGVIEYHYAALYTLALSSISVYGLLFAGWSANSAYAFLGGLRSTAQMVSYELVLSSAVLGVLMVGGSFSYTRLAEVQEGVWFFVPLFPLFILWLVSMLAETNRTPFDLPEGESELVSGFMTEHSAVPFVLFFLAEYGALLLMSTVTSLLYLGSYGAPCLVVNGSFISLSALVLSLKTCLGVLFFVWIRATLPRLRFDQLLSFCWTQLLPMAIALVLLVPSLLVAFNIAPN